MVPAYCCCVVYNVSVFMLSLFLWSSSSNSLSDSPLFLMYSLLCKGLPYQKVDYNFAIRCTLHNIGDILAGSLEMTAYCHFRNLTRISYFLEDSEKAGKHYHLQRLHGAYKHGVSTVKFWLIKPSDCFVKILNAFYG